MNKTNVKCHRCHFNQLYKFRIDKQANQKYQCKNVSINLPLTPSALNQN